ncbi:hypothetical protein [Mycoplasmopsis fermentans]|uniref:hypothetical protein n=1 Tax=Mycoplasmopsis fermentans TaxID=2115 RepID=UPI000F03FD29|nr:hypothetical protein [Mycoplasmopsis fermentans]RMX35298.1 hypothetical protein MFI2_0472 [Mycoplasmopsis fermentans MF-I2]RMX35437.1 hypothetical protein MFI1_0488 [Mycoplasmopsis fermentans MF-I1]
MKKHKIIFALTPFTLMPLTAISCSIESPNDYENANKWSKESNKPGMKESENILINKLIKSEFKITNFYNEMILNKEFNISEVSSRITYNKNFKAFNNSDETTTNFDQNSFKTGKIVNLKKYFTWNKGVQYLPSWIQYDVQSYFNPLSSKFANYVTEDTLYLKLTLFNSCALNLKTQHIIYAFTNSNKTGRLITTDNTLELQKLTQIS